MRFFTLSLWRQSGYQAHDSHKVWAQAFRDYREQLSALRDRVNKEAFSFFEEAPLHDGELLSLNVTDGSRPAPSSGPSRPWQTVLGYPVKVELAILDAMNEFVWRLSYSGVRRITIDYPSEDTARPIRGGFGDWGYDELTDAGNGFLRHEVLFRSASVLMFEFRDLTVAKTLARAGDTPNYGLDPEEPR